MRSIKVVPQREMKSSFIPSPLGEMAAVLQEHLAIARNAGEGLKIISCMVENFVNVQPRYSSSF